ncbi:alpha/beta fold hydrolase [Saccharopolyspora phatthalungensis]|uniref:Pimeloyl-ACP methyl ester carboxylesterase n=1 Tax=Saccharopolyspora phatthalungensis TaxID=664693 RepID=A0A840QFP2_9PSEU|nr:alpha/beta hydrolase [Saccharopolyspora phatthalungensis]MBB5158750.1 pimeloyl-ACP methyl ester carboxylesterase [Saccharopolyspora phatthalungensis]
MLDLPVHYFPGRDGTRLAYRELGQGRPLVLLHGFFSLATQNWVRPGHAETIAARSHRVIMPDLRGHGDSAKPHEISSYPRDVLADDGFALVEHLGLDGYDLGGYSLGGRTVIRMLARGAMPERAIVAGQGMHEITGLGGGVGTFLRRVFGGLGTFAPGSPEWKAERWLRSVDGDPVALQHVLDTVVNTTPDAVARIQVPTLVVAGADDDRDGSTPALAAALPRGSHAVVPGDHTTATAAPELAAAIVAFLGSVL